MSELPTYPNPLHVFSLKDPSHVLTIPVGTCLLAYRGSIAHGIHNPDPQSIDDIDLIGIVLASPSVYLGLSEWGSRGTQETKIGRWDMVLYEARKMFSLLLQGNPNVLSTLWCEPQHYINISPQGKEILNSREIFVGRHVYHSFAGYASAQLKKMEARDPAELREYIAVTNELKYRGLHPNHKGESIPYPNSHSMAHGEGKNAALSSANILLSKLRSFQKKGENVGYMGDKRKQMVVDFGFDCKNAAHCIRLLKMCAEFLSTGRLNVYRKSDREELLAIKHGAWKVEDVKKYAEQLFVEAQAAYKSADQLMPDGPDKVAAEKLLISILREHLSIPTSTRTP